MSKSKRQSDAKNRQALRKDLSALAAEPTDVVIQFVDSALRKRFPDYYASLRPGLTDRKLTFYEKKLGIVLPEDYKTLLRWKDGSQEDHAPYWNGQFCGRMDALEEAKSTMEVTHAPHFHIEPDEDVNAWWNPGWIPLIRGYMSSDMLCLDTVGSFTGKAGQILEFIHDARYRPIKHENINRWLVTTYFAIAVWDDIPYATAMKKTKVDISTAQLIELSTEEQELEEIANPGYPIRFGVNGLPL